MARPLLFVAMFLAAPAAAHAQQAYCDCCGQLYSPPGATWIGASRAHGGLCDSCRGWCLNCREKADDVRTQYETYNRMRGGKGLTAAQAARLDRYIDRARQRWSDLRYSCLAGGGTDIGRLDPGAADRPPSRGLATPDTKKRLRDYARQIVDEYEEFYALADQTSSMNDPVIREQVFDTIREHARRADLLNRLADDPPDPDFEKVVAPKIDPEPKDDGKPKEFQALHRANVAQKNANACADAYITSFERYQAARKVGNKDAANRQVQAMGKFAHQAEEQARAAATRLREFERSLLERIEVRRSELAKAGAKWQDELKSAQEKVRDRWPADVARALEGAKVPARAAEAVRTKFLGLTPEAVEKAMADRRSAIELDDAAAAAAAARKAGRLAPEPPELGAILLMEQQAHLLHAELAGRKRDLPKDDPFPAPKKGGKK